MDLTYKMINRTSSLQFDQVRNLSMNGITFVFGGYFIIDVQFASGVVLRASFLRYNNAWSPIYGFLQPPTQNINNGPSSNSLPPLLLMSSGDVNNDMNLQQALNQLSGRIQ
jgi:hypothetical protein